MYGGGSLFGSIYKYVPTRNFEISCYDYRYYYRLQSSIYKLIFLFYFCKPNQIYS